MKFQNLILNIEDGLATLTLNRPEKLNALSIVLFKELAKALSLIDEPELGIRGLILTGAGTRAFSVGGDIQEMETMSCSQGRELSELAQNVTLQLENLRVPVIACVDGFALGGGCELAMSCDFIYATERSHFGQPEVKIGLIPGFGGCVRLARLVGPAMAKEIIYTGRQIAAGEALQLKIANRLFESKSELLKNANSVLIGLKKKSAMAIAVAKRAVNDCQGLPTKKGLLVEQTAYGSIFEHPEKVEGIRAFLEKRPANFK